MLGQQRLVGCHHMLAVEQRALYKFSGNAFFAADQFHHNISIAVCKRQWIVRASR